MEKLNLFGKIKLYFLAICIQFIISSIAIWYHMGFYNYFNEYKRELWDGYYDFKRNWKGYIKFILK